MLIRVSVKPEIKSCLWGCHPLPELSDPGLEYT